MVFGSEPIRGGPLIESGCISGGLEKWILERPRQTETTGNWSLRPGCQSDQWTRRDCWAFMRVIFLDPPGQELGVNTQISGAHASLPVNTDAIFLENEATLKTQGPEHRGGVQMNSDNFQQGVSLSESHEFLCVVEGQSQGLSPH